MKQEIFLEKLQTKEINVDCNYIEQKIEEYKGESDRLKQLIVTFIESKDKSKEINLDSDTYLKWFINFPLTGERTIEGKVSTKVLEELYEKTNNEFFSNLLQYRKLKDKRQKYEKLETFALNGILKPEFNLKTNGKVYTSQPSLIFPTEELEQLFQCKSELKDDLRQVMKTFETFDNQVEYLPITVIGTTIFYKERSQEELARIQARIEEAQREMAEFDAMFEDTEENQAKWAREKQEREERVAEYRRQTNEKVNAIMQNVGELELNGYEVVKNTLKSEVFNCYHTYHLIPALVEKVTNEPATMEFFEQTEGLTTALVKTTNYVFRFETRKGKIVVKAFDIANEYKGDYQEVFTFKGTNKETGEEFENSFEPDCLNKESKVERVLYNLNDLMEMVRKGDHELWTAIAIFYDNLELVADTKERSLIYNYYMLRLKDRAYEKVGYTKEEGEKIRQHIVHELTDCYL